LPFNLQGDAKAALNLYSDVPNKFDERASARARGYTREISQALRLAVRFSLHTDSAANLRATLESRTIIDIAVGIVMAQNRCSQDAAVRILTDASSNSNTKIRDIAKSLVESVGGTGTRTHYQEPDQAQAG
jgi:predicted dinucleotide-binding enzyme